jgi:hypothetical protein
MAGTVTPIVPAIAGCAAVEADIFVAEDGRPWRAPTWPSADGVALILCPSGGELDDEGDPFCSLGGPGDGENGCIECKGAGMSLLVSIYR